MLWLLHHYG